MPRGEHDQRTWIQTDREGERLSIGRPIAGIEVMSVRGSHRHWREAHSGFTLALVHRTENAVIAEWRTRGRSLSTEGGEMMAIEPGDTHVTNRLKMRSVGADFDIVRFSPELLGEVARRMDSPRPFHFKAPGIKDAPSFGALSGLVHAAAGGCDSLELQSAAAAAMSSVVARLGESNGAVSSVDPVRDYRLRKVKDYLRAHLVARPTLSDLERVTGVCQWRLCCIFKRAYGMTVGQYWNALRLDEAVRRLQQGVPVRMIVAELGYTDEPYFSRVFKKHYGVAPGRWLSLYRANDSVINSRTRGFDP